MSHAHGDDSRASQSARLRRSLRDPSACHSSAPPPAAKIRAREIPEDIVQRPTRAPPEFLLRPRGTRRRSAHVDLQALTTLRGQPKSARGGVGDVVVTARYVIDAVAPTRTSATLEAAELTQELGHVEQFCPCGVHEGKQSQVQ